MKKTKFYSSAVLLGIAAMVITGCAKVPQVEIDAANAAVQDARNSGAEQYAAESFNALQDSLRSALESVEAEGSSFFKNYDESIALLNAVVAQSGDVKAQTEAQKESLKREIASAINDIKTLLVENQQLISEAPQGKEGTTALLAIKGELETIEVAVVDSENLLQNGELISSKDKALAAREKVISINEELKSVISKYKSARKSR